jgi:hypothetical protein
MTSSFSEALQKFGTMARWITMSIGPQRKGGRMRWESFEIENGQTWRKDYAGGRRDTISLIGNEKEGTIEKVVVHFDPLNDPTPLTVLGLCALAGIKTEIDEPDWWREPRRGEW